MDLTPEFQAGLRARYDAGRCLENLPGKPDCPHYATSPCADAWWTGWAFASCAMASASIAVYDPVKATTGRGDRVNVHCKGGAKFSFHMDYDRAPCPAYLEA